MALRRAQRRAMLQVWNPVQALVGMGESTEALWRALVGIGQSTEALLLCCVQVPFLRAIRAVDERYEDMRELQTTLLPKGGQQGQRQVLLL